MLEENIVLILDVLINNKKSMSIDEIIEDTALDAGLVSHACNMLKLIEVIVKKSDDKFHLVKEVKGINLAKAAQLGINLESFNYFEVSPKEKKLALDLATKTEKLKSIDLSNRKPLVQKRNYFSLNKTDDIAENLIILMEASNLSLYEYLEELSKKDDYLKTLLNMHRESENSLISYVDYLR